MTKDLAYISECAVLQTVSSFRATSPSAMTVSDSSCLSSKCFRYWIRVLKLLWISGFCIKEILRRNREKFTDIEKIRHSRECFAIFNSVDISGVWPIDRLMSLAETPFFMRSWVRRRAEIFFIHVQSPSFRHIVSNKVVKSDGIYLLLSLKYRIICDTIRNNE